MLGTFLNLDCNIRIVFEIFCKPNCAEMSPTKFLDNHISVNQYLTYMDRMITTYLVIRHAFIFTWVLIIKKRIINHMTQRSKIKMSVILLLWAILVRLKSTFILLRSRFRVRICSRLLLQFFTLLVFLFALRFSLLFYQLFCFWIRFI